MISEPPHNSGHLKSDKSKFCIQDTNIRDHSTVLSFPGDLVPGICAPLQLNKHTVHMLPYIPFGVLKVRH